MTKVEVITFDFEPYFNHLVEDFKNWWSANGTKELTEYQKQSIQEYAAGLTIEEGSKYIKVVTKRGDNSASVHSFVVKKADKKFAVGTILKAAGWSAPAKNFGRGNLFTGDFKNVKWTGAQ